MTWGGILKEKLSSASRPRAVPGGKGWIYSVELTTCIGRNAMRQLQYPHPPKRDGWQLPIAIPPGVWAAADPWEARLCRKLGIVAYQKSVWFVRRVRGGKILDSRSTTWRVPLWAGLVLDYRPFTETRERALRWLSATRDRRDAARALTMARRHPLELYERVTGARIMSDDDRMWLREFYTGT